MARREIHVVPYGGRWAVKVGGELVVAGVRKADAMRVAHDYAAGAETASIRVHNRKGVIVNELSFGSDPFPPAG